MQKINYPMGVWTKVFTGVTSAAFNLINSYPDPIQKCGYKITYGSTEPAVDTDVYSYYELDRDATVFAYPIQFTNSTAANVYVMPMFESGAITY